MAERIVTFDEWKAAHRANDKFAQRVIRHLTEYMTSGRSHWLEFSIDDERGPVVRVTTQGRAEAALEEQINQHGTGHA